MKGNNTNKNEISEEKQTIKEELKAQLEAVNTEFENLAEEREKIATDNQELTIKVTELAEAYDTAFDDGVAESNDNYEYEINAKNEELERVRKDLVAVQNERD